MRAYNRYVESGVGFSLNYVIGGIMAVVNAAVGIYLLYSAGSLWVGVNFLVGFVFVVAILDLHDDAPAPGCGDWVVNIKGFEVAPSEIFFGAGVTSAAVFALWILVGLGILLIF